VNSADKTFAVYFEAKKLIGMNSRFAKINKKTQEQKMVEKLNNFEKFERKIKYQPCSQRR
jgi:hypothetical protein